MAESFLTEFPEALVVCAPLVFPVCQDFEEEFLSATRCPWVDMVPLKEVLVHVVLEVRGVLAVVTRTVPRVNVKKTGTVRSGVAEDDVLGGCVLAPCGRHVDFEKNEFVLARMAGEVRLGADAFLTPQLLAKGIIPNNDLSARMRFDATEWVRAWKAISHL